MRKDKLNHGEVVCYGFDGVVLFQTGEYSYSAEIAEFVKGRWTGHSKSALGITGFSFSAREGGLALEVETGPEMFYRCGPVNDDFRKMFSRQEWFVIICFGGIVVTIDGYICAGRRKSSEVQSPGKIDIPMGNPMKISDRPREMAFDKICQELGVDESLEVVEMIPLAFIQEHPNEGYDLVYSVLIKITREELEELGSPPEHKERFFIKDDREEILELFSRIHDSDEPLLFSPPVVPSIGIYGRLKYGERWFRDFLRTVHRF